MKQIPAKLFSIFLLSAILPFGLAAQSMPPAATASGTPATGTPVVKPAVPMPSVDEVLNNYEKAIGGRDAWMKIKTPRVEGHDCDSTVQCGRDGRGSPEGAE